MKVFLYMHLLAIITTVSELSPITLRSLKKLYINISPH